MTKQAAESAPTEAPAPAPKSARARGNDGKFQAGATPVPAGKVTKPSETQTTGERLVMSWDDRETAGFTDGGELDAAAAPTEEGTETPAPEGGEPVAEPEETTPAETPSGKTEAPKPAEDPAADRRARALAALEVQKLKVDLEQQVTTWRTKAEGLESKLKNGTVAERLALANFDKQTLEDMFLTGSDELAQVPDRAAAPDPEIVALKDEVKALREWKAQNDAEKASQAIERGLTIVREAVAPIEAPMVKTVRDIVIDGNHIKSGYDLVLQTAHHAWLEAGKAGHPRDHIPKATEVVEAYLREKRPDLMPAATAPKDPPAEEPAAPAAKRPVAVGKKTGARPDPNPEPLPVDREDRDQVIMKRYGWL